MSPVLKSSVAYIATKLLALAPAAAAQLCSLDSCLLDKLANVRWNHAAACCMYLCAVIESPTGTAACRLSGATVVDKQPL